MIIETSEIPIIESAYDIWIRQKEESKILIKNEVDNNAIS